MKRWFESAFIKKDPISALLKTSDQFYKNLHQLLNQHQDGGCILSELVSVSAEFISLFRQTKPYKINYNSKLVDPLTEFCKLLIHSLADFLETPPPDYNSTTILYSIDLYVTLTGDFPDTSGFYSLIEYLIYGSKTPTEQEIMASMMVVYMENISFTKLLMSKEFFQSALNSILNDTTNISSLERFSATVYEETPVKILEESTSVDEEGTTSLELLLEAIQKGCVPNTNAKSLCMLFAAALKFYSNHSEKVLAKYVADYSVVLEIVYVYLSDADKTAVADVFLALSKCHTRLAENTLCFISTKAAENNEEFYESVIHVIRDNQLKNLFIEEIMDREKILSAFEHNDEKLVELFDALADANYKAIGTCAKDIFEIWRTRNMNYKAVSLFLKTCSCLVNAEKMSLDELVEYGFLECVMMNHNKDVAAKLIENEETVILIMLKCWNSMSSETPVYYLNSLLSLGVGHNIKVMTMFLQTFSTCDVLKALLENEDVPTCEILSVEFRRSSSLVDMFMQLNGMDYIDQWFNSGVREMNSLVDLLLAIQTHEFVEHITLWVSHLPKTHPFFSLPEDRLEELACDCKIPALYVWLGKRGDDLGPYEMWLIARYGFVNVEVADMNDNQMRLFRRTANRYISREHLMMLLTESHVSELADTSIDHFPIVELQEDKVLEFEPENPFIALWCKYVPVRNPSQPSTFLITPYVSISFDDKSCYFEFENSKGKISSEHSKWHCFTLTLVNNDVLLLTLDQKVVKHNLIHEIETLGKIQIYSSSNGMMSIGPRISEYSSIWSMAKIQQKCREGPDYLEKDESDEKVTEIATVMKNVRYIPYIGSSIWIKRKSVWFEVIELVMDCTDTDRLDDFFDFLLNSYTITKGTIEKFWQSMIFLVYEKRDLVTYDTFRKVFEVGMRAVSDENCDISLIDILGNRFLWEAHEESLLKFIDCYQHEIRVITTDSAELMRCLICFGSHKEVCSLIITSCIYNPTSESVTMLLHYLISLHGTSQQMAYEEFLAAMKRPGFASLAAQLNMSHLIDLMIPCDTQTRKIIYHIISILVVKFHSELDDPLKTACILLDCGDWSPVLPFVMSCLAGVEYREDLVISAEECSIKDPQWVAVFYSAVVFMSIALSAGECPELQESVEEWMMIFSLMEKKDHPPFQQDNIYTILCLFISLSKGHFSQAIQNTLTINSENAFHEVLKVWKSPVSGIPISHAEVALTHISTANFKPIIAHFCEGTDEWSFRNIEGLSSVIYSMLTVIRDEHFATVLRAMFVPTANEEYRNMLTNILMSMLTSKQSISLDHIVELLSVLCVCFKEKYLNQSSHMKLFEHLFVLLDNAIAEHTIKPFLREARTILVLSFDVLAEEDLLILMNTHLKAVFNWKTLFDIDFGYAMMHALLNFRAVSDNRYMTFFASFVTKVILAKPYLDKIKSREEEFLYIIAKFIPGLKIAVTQNRRQYDIWTSQNKSVVDDATRLFKRANENTKKTDTCSCNAQTLEQICAKAAMNVEYERLRCAMQREVVAYAVGRQMDILRIHCESVIASLALALHHTSLQIVDRFNPLSYISGSKAWPGETPRLSYPTPLSLPEVNLGAKFDIEKFASEKNIASHSWLTKYFPIVYGHKPYTGIDTDAVVSILNMKEAEFSCVRLLIHENPLPSVIISHRDGFSVLVGADVIDNSIVFTKTAPEEVVSYLTFYTSAMIGCMGEITVFEGHIMFSVAYSSIVHVRPHMIAHKECAFEVFTWSESPFIVITGPDTSPAFLSDLQSLKSTVPHDKFLFQDSVEAAKAKWKAGKMTSYQYLLNLNWNSGRSFVDLAQYPVFPWVISDYETETVTATKHRDLSKPMGQLDERRALRFQKMYDDNHSHFYGTHYSIASAVHSFMCRMVPFTFYEWDLHQGWDHHARIFSDMQISWESSSRENNNDLRELIPEMYSVPEIVTGNNSLKIPNMKLPKWAPTPFVFVNVMRKALESDQSLHSWIDLIFGYKQHGSAAVAAKNLFHPMAYHSAGEAPQSEYMQLMHWGQCPLQLFTKPHPPRGELPTWNYYNTKCYRQNDAPTISSDVLRAVSGDVECRVRPSQMKTRVVVRSGGTFNLVAPWLQHVSSISICRKEIFIAFNLTSEVVIIMRLVYTNNRATDFVFFTSFEVKSERTVIDSTNWLCASITPGRVILWDFARCALHRIIPTEKTVNVVFDEYMGILWIASPDRTAIYTVNGVFVAEMVFTNTISCTACGTILVDNDTSRPVYHGFTDGVVVALAYVPELDVITSLGSWHASDASIADIGSTESGVSVRDSAGQYHIITKPC